MQSLIELKNITKAFEDNVILDDFNLTVNRNEFITLLGPSGCGKTTTLRIVGGFENPDEGKVILRVKILPIYLRTKDISIQFSRNMLFFLT